MKSFTRKPLLPVVEETVVPQLAKPATAPQKKVSTLRRAKRNVTHAIGVCKPNCIKCQIKATMDRIDILAKERNGLKAELTAMKQQLDSIQKFIQDTITQLNTVRQQYALLYGMDAHRDSNLRRLKLMEAQLVQRKQENAEIWDTYRSICASLGKSPTLDGPQTADAQIQVELKDEGLLEQAQSVVDAQKRELEHNMAEIKALEEAKAKMVANHSARMQKKTSFKDFLIAKFTSLKNCLIK